MKYMKQFLTKFLALNTVIVIVSGGRIGAGSLSPILLPILVLQKYDKNIMF